MAYRAVRTALALLCWLPVGLVWLLAGCALPGEEQAPALTAESRLRVAQAAETAGNRDMALAMYTAAAAAAPADTPTQLLAAEGLARNGRLEEATTLLSRRLQGAPHDMAVLQTLGAVQVMGGRSAQAVQTLSEVLAANPDNLKALVNKAIALDILRLHGEAQGLYRHALALAPGDPVISNDLAVSLLLSGQPEEARRILLALGDMNGLPERIRNNLGVMDAAGGRGEEAQRLLGAQIDPAGLAVLTRAIRREGGGDGR